MEKIFIGDNMETRQSYFEKMKKVLDDLNLKISELEVKMENAARDFKEKYKPELEDLKSLKKQIETKLEDLKDPAKDAWSDVRDGLDKAAGELNAALKKAFGRFKQDQT
ncbi:MAG: hypothetical protein R6W90_05235 [Ignavibacteriaceae bacterium]